MNIRQLKLQNRYLLKHEIADQALYEKYHPGMSYQNRIESLKYLKTIGYQIGSGVIIDLPGQTPEILAEDLLLSQDLKLDMIGSGPFIPHEQTAGPYPGHNSSRNN
jgi:biotin synthase